VHNAQILVVNHSLFFSDLGLRRSGISLLPDYDVVIFDEAHTLEAVAADHLGDEVTSFQVEHLCNKLFNPRTKRGLLCYHDFNEGILQVEATREAANSFFGSIATWRTLEGGSNGRIHKELPIEDCISGQLHALTRALDKLAESVENDEQKQEIVASSERSAAIATSIASWLSQDSPGFVYWVDVSTGRRRRVTLAAAPVDVGTALETELYQKIPTCVMTSATLSVGRQPSFEFFQKRLGLHQCHTLRLGSPFNYREQAKIHIAADMPDPGSRTAEFEARAADAIRYYLRLTRGGAFVLFTSYRMLKDVAARLTDWLAEQALPVFSQAEGTPRSKLVEQFRQHPNAVLFGTDSFWQGVDVPGDALRNVIITKLPFSVPDHPLLEARLDSIRARGGNPFMEYQLPEAVLKLKQGFGRLVRTRRDSGIVAILDPRVLTKPYGRMFLESLPDCTHVLDNGESLMD
jgi:ATP-dependent DNA helicase DinG